MRAGSHHTEEAKKKLSVHHVNYKKDACCNPEVLPMFAPVCSGHCHAVTSHNRPYWEKYFTGLINEKFDGKCYLPMEYGVI